MTKEFSPVAYMEMVKISIDESIINDVKLLKMSAIIRQQRAEGVSLETIYEKFGKHLPLDSMNLTVATEFEKEKTVLTKIRRDLYGGFKVLKMSDYEYIRNRIVEMAQVKKDNLIPDNSGLKEVVYLSTGKSHV